MGGRVWGGDDPEVAWGQELIPLPPTAGDVGTLLDF